LSLYSCIQKEPGPDEGISDKTKFFLEASLEELKENYVFPSITLVIIFLYQISRALIKNNGLK